MVLYGPRESAIRDTFASPSWDAYGSLPLVDKLLLRKRSIIELLLAKLKPEMGLEHSRHRSPINALVISSPVARLTPWP